MRWRLGLQLFPDGATCQRAVGKAVGDEELCAKSMDKWGDDALGCSCGFRRGACHASMRQLVSDASRLAGYRVLQEQMVPEFPKHKRRRGREMVEEDAYLDGLFIMWHTVTYSSMFRSGCPLHSIVLQLLPALMRRQDRRERLTSGSATVRHERYR